VYPSLPISWTILRTTDCYNPILIKNSLLTTPLVRTVKVRKKFLRTLFHDVWSRQTEGHGARPLEFLSRIQWSALIEFLGKGNISHTIKSAASEYIRTSRGDGSDRVFYYLPTCIYSWSCRRRLSRFDVSSWALMYISRVILAL
jgi:hypothetical protein